MNDDHKGSFSFFVKAIAIGEEVYWTEEKTFTAKCGIESTYIIDNDFDYYQEFAINGDIPYFQILPYVSDYFNCPVDNYQLFME